MRRRGKTRIPAGLAAAAVAVAAAVLLPAAYLVIRSAQAGLPAVAGVVFDSRTAGLLFRTAGLAVAVTAAAVAAGVPLAWLTARTDLPARRLWSVVLALPLVIPSYLAGYTFVSALGPRGIVQGWLAPLGVDRLPSIYGFWGALAVLSIFNYPYVFLTARAALARMDPAREEAARTLGHSRTATFFRVILPQLRPAILAGGLLVALYTLHDFGAVSILRFDTFTRAIYVQYQGSFDRTPAAILALVLAAATLGILAAERRMRGRTDYMPAATSRSATPAPLGRWRWAAAGGCGVVALTALGLPLMTVGFWLAHAIRSGEGLSIAASGALNSVQASALGAVAAMACAWPVALLASRHPGRLPAAVERASFIGFGLPGVVVALSLVFFGARFAPFLYQTRFMLVFAYVVLFLPQATGSLRASLVQVPRSLEEAARTLGDTRLAAMRRVVVPMVRPGIFAGLALVFLTAMKELPATLLLAPAGFATLATRVWGATNDAFFSRAAPSALALILLASIPLAFLVARDATGPLSGPSS